MLIRMLESNNIATFPTPQRTVNAVKALVSYSAFCGNKECILNIDLI